MRSGKRSIEYSPSILGGASEAEISTLLKHEVIRILLGHPYKRRPYNAKPGILTLASEATRAQLEHPGINFITSEPENPALQFLSQKLGPHATFNQMTFEQWYKYIYDLVKSSKGGQSAGSGIDENLDNFSETSELWDEDEEALKDIQNHIESAECDEGFGSMGESLSRELKKSADFSFDYRRALSKFRQNIVSANRKLTRMRPSRRYGFKAMGSRYERKANVLIAVDVSGSITDESFDHFIHAIKNFFFLGIIEKIDLIFFDVNLKFTKPVNYKKKINLNEVKGRGGTNFQIPADFYNEHKSDYSGMIIFTDGEGQPPVVDGGNILWILDSRLHYENCRQWITKHCKNQATFLPF